MHIFNKRHSGYFLLVGLSLSLIFGIFTSAPLSAMLAASSAITLSAIFLYRPAVGFLLFLFLRPSLDGISDTFSAPLIGGASVSASALLGMLLVALSIPVFIRYGKIFPKTSLRFLIFSILVVFLASIAYSVDPLSSVYETIRAASIFVSFALAFIFIRMHALSHRALLSVILLSGIIPIAAAIYQFTTGSGLSRVADIDGRVYGTFTHPNSFASFVLILIAVLVFFLMTNTRKVWSASGLLATISILVGTMSRGAWIALGIFTFFIGIFRSPKILLFAAVVAGAIFFSSQSVRDRVADVYPPPPDSSLVWRLQQWSKVYGVFLASPLFGTGAGTEIVVHEREFGFFAGSPYTHNDFLKIALENGIVGATLYGALHLFILISLLLLWKKRSGSTQIYTLIVGILWIAEIGFSMSSNIWRSTATMWLLWALLGAALAAETRKHKTTQTDRLTRHS